MVLNELKAAGVPAWGQEESATGLVTAMPTSPSQAPSVAFIVRVPEPAAEDARRIIESLPIAADQRPGVWHTGPDRKTKRALQIVVLIFFVLLFVSWIDDVVRWILRLL